MGQPTELSASQHVYATFIYPAQESPKGKVFTLPSPGQAFYYYKRLQNIRWRERAQSRKVYSPGDPGYGRSSFEDLIITRDGATLTLSKGALLPNVESQDL